MKDTRAVLFVVIIISASVVLFYAWSTYSPMIRPACDVMSVSTQSQYVTNGGFEQGFQGWVDLFGQGNNTALLSSDDPRCGTHSLELVTLQTANSTGVSLAHRLNLGQCTTPAGTTFGLLVKNGLTLSLWHRTPNATQTRFGFAVTFHNGSSKLEIDYLLAFKGIPARDWISPDLRDGRVEVVLNTSNGAWHKSSIDLFHDFAKYFGVDPVVRHYCVNYILLWQGPVSDTNFGAIPAVRFQPGSRSYAFFDDIDFYLSTPA
ncbi:MAG TPA: hypothetical protein VGR56_05105 [Nitrososphaerales archaeon]|nr:hypothetical protein [Nitrososphaerales archaeon]